MGIHYGPIKEITDVNDSANVTGAGINMAQRVMDCGDAGHILFRSTSPTTSNNTASGGRSSIPWANAK